VIHPTAIIDPKATLGSDVQIGPYAVIEKHVSIGSGTVIGPHVVIGPFVEVESDCRIHQGAAIGGEPQSVEYGGEETHVHIGCRTIVREFATIHRGTGFGGGVTRIGEDCYLMAYAHVGHDSIVGSHAMLVNNATLAGHVTVGEHAQVGALTPVHQFCRIGDHAFIGGGSVVIMDVPPYVMAVGNRAKLNGLNTVGLRRQGFTRETMSILKEVYSIVFRSKLRLNEAVERIDRDVDQIAEVVNFTDFIRSSKRGIIR